MLDELCLFSARATMPMLSKKKLQAMKLQSHRVRRKSVNGGNSRREAFRTATILLPKLADTRTLRLPSDSRLLNFRCKDAMTGRCGCDVSEGVYCGLRRDPRSATPRCDSPEAPLFRLVSINATPGIAPDKSNPFLSAYIPVHTSRSMNTESKKRIADM